MRRRVLAALAVPLALVLGGCGGDPEPSADPSSGGSATSPTPSPTDEPSVDDPTSGAPRALSWQPVAGPASEEVTVSGPWTLALPEDGATVRLDGPDPQTFRAPDGYRFSTALLDGEHAVVVAEHEQGAEPNVVTVVELATGTPLDVDVPAGVGGSWALGSGLLAGTLSQGREYCIATTDLVSGRSETGPCVPPRHGISNLAISPSGLTAMTFDDGRPSCRTLNRVEGGGFDPIAGAEDCRGWEAVSTETAAIWGEVVEERRVEASEFFLDAGSGPVELGPGTTGTLTWCGDAAYLVRDPQRGSDPARLLRVDVEAGTTEVVYESRGAGRAFLSAPRCGATDLTVTAYSSAGDEQVTARLD